MSMRITQSMMYSSFTGRMNNNLSDLMESNIQSGSQKRINRPSDDASGAARVVNLNATISTLKQYKENIDKASGWLSVADSTLASGDGSVQTLLTRIKELAEQGATGTYTADNRAQISFELRQSFEQLINLSNTTFNGKHIFSGHKTDQPAYVAGLGANSNDPSLAGMDFVVEGGASKSIIIQARGSGNADSVGYEYSDDGGKTWQAATVDAALPSPPYAAGKTRINAGGAGVIVDSNSTMTVADPTKANETDNGSWIYVRPTAVYQGDDHDNQVVSLYGTTTPATASGAFTRDTAVRIESVAGGLITYSYSTDDGGNWTQATSPDLGANSKLPLPSGFLNLQGTPSPAEQYLVHPHRAEINFTISNSSSITVNLVGKDIFGGLYNDPSNPSNSPTVVPGEGNIFEVVGRLIGYAETGSQDGMSKAVAEIDACMHTVLTRTAEVGGRSNRLQMTKSALALRQFDEEDSLSQAEDVDIMELTTRLSQQSTAYNSVLKSSSMIMQMSLVNFL